MKNIFENIDQGFESYSQNLRRNKGAVLSNYNHAVSGFKYTEPIGFSFSRVKKGTVKPIIPLSVVSSHAERFISGKAKAIKENIGKQIYMSIQSDILTDTINSVEESKMNYVDSQVQKLKDIKRKWNDKNPDFSDPIKQSYNLEVKKSESYLMTSEKAEEKLRLLTAGKIHMDNAEVGLLISKLPEEVRRQKIPSITKALNKLPERWNFENAEEVDKIVHKINAVFESDPGTIPLINTETNLNQGVLSSSDVWNNSVREDVINRQKNVSELFA